MAEELEFLSLEGLKVYDAQVKEYILSKIKDKSLDIQEIINTLEQSLNNSLASIRADFHKYWETAYPIGSIYITTETDEEKTPMVLFGGTWARITGKFLFADDEVDYFVGDTGGEETHRLTIAEMPTHDHAEQTNDGSTSGWYRVLMSNGNGNNGWGPNNETYRLNTHTDYEGGGQSHNNMPPYLVVKMWRRIA